MYARKSLAVVFFSNTFCMRSSVTLHRILFNFDSKYSAAPRVRGVLLYILDTHAEVGDAILKIL